MLVGVVEWCRSIAVEYWLVGMWYADGGGGSHSPYDVVRGVVGRC